MFLLYKVFTDFLFITFKQSLFSINASFISSSVLDFAIDTILPFMIWFQIWAWLSFCTNDSFLLFSYFSSLLLLNTIFLCAHYVNWITCQWVIESIYGAELTFSIFRHQILVWWVNLKKNSVKDLLKLVSILWIGILMHWLRILLLLGIRIIYLFLLLQRNFSS